MDLDDVLARALDDIEKVSQANNLSTTTSPTNSTTSATTTSSTNSNSNNNNNNNTNNNNNNNSSTSNITTQTTSLTQQNVNTNIPPSTLTDPTANLSPEEEKELMNSFKNMMEQMFSSLPPSSSSSSTSPNPPPNFSSTPPPPTDPNTPLSQTFKDAVKNLNNPNPPPSSSHSNIPPNLGSLSDDEQSFAMMLQQLLASDPNLDPNNPNANPENLDSAPESEWVEGLMKKLFGPLLDKETFYEPMASMRDKYRIMLQNWGIDGHGEGKSEEDKKRYEEQLKCICQMCEVYEKEPVDTSKVFELVNEIRVHGSPPEEIIREVAPGMENKMDGSGFFDMFGGLGAGGAPVGTAEGGVGVESRGDAGQERLPTPEELAKECCLM